LADSGGWPTGKPRPGARQVRPLYIKFDVIAGYTFGLNHDRLVAQLTNLGIPDVIANVPSMPLAYVVSYFQEMRNGIIEQLTNSTDSCPGK
jgi:hypothetical protein